MNLDAAARTDCAALHPDGDADLCVLHVAETWRALAAEGVFLTNRPEVEETLAAIAELRAAILAPIRERFGAIEITYGFAGAELVRAVRARAKALGRLPNIHPPGDQHAGHEVGPKGARTCKRDGFAVDLRVPGHSSERVADWVRETLNFDRLYAYDAERPFHVSVAKRPVRQAIRMIPKQGGGLYPQVLAVGARFSSRGAHR